jgi:hypothetical protein
MNKKGVAPFTVMIWWTGFLLVSAVGHGIAKNELHAPNFKAKPFTVDTVANPAPSGWDLPEPGKNHGNF